jgi:hypothetical protein
MLSGDVIFSSFPGPSDEYVRCGIVHTIRRRQDFELHDLNNQGNSRDYDAFELGEHVGWTLTTE